MALEQPEVTEQEEAEALKQAEKDFGEGFSDGAPPDKKPAIAPETKPETKPEAKTESEVKPAEEPPKPKYRRITEEQFIIFDAAAKKTVALEQQLSKVFGTLGDQQQIVRNLQAQTPKGAKVEVPENAFADLAKDFPELAKQIRAAMEASLKGVVGTGAAAPTPLDHKKVAEEIAEGLMKRELAVLEDAFPDWRKIMGAVDTRYGGTGVVDPANPYRIWLASKDQAYQDRINQTNSPMLLERSLRLFRKETTAKAPPPKPGGNGNLRQKFFAARAREAIQPRGDGGRAQPTTPEDEFAEGFRTG